MIVARDRAELAEATGAFRNGRGSTLGFVPTMGSLHEGHVSLVRRSAATDGLTVASVFVNPTQFGPGEDFDSYPRDESGDSGLLEAAGCDVLFLPGVEDIYPPGFATTVAADRGLTGCLCGAGRGESHFDGVTTVVARLFGLVRPDRAYFGEKDWQQMRVIERMAEDLMPSVAIVRCPTVRRADGVAMSSRNAYLDTGEDALARGLRSAMAAAAESIASGRRTTREAVGQALLELDRSGFEVEYLELRHGDDLSECAGPATDRCERPHDEPARLFAAARLGRTRLIDNLPLPATAALPDTPDMTARRAADAQVAEPTG